MSLTSDQQAAFARDGFIVLEGFTDPKACDALTARALDIVDAFTSEEISVFLAHDGSLNKDEYFLSSGDKIRCFFEEEAFDAQGNLKQDLALSINKIGHAMHDLDDVFDGFSRADNVCDLVAALPIKDPRALQSMYIFKQPRIGGEVTYHQDATYLYTEPSSVIGLWWALEDATIENGCLWAWPGGHHEAVRARLLRNPDDTVRYEVFDEAPWPADKFVPLEVPKGTLVAFGGNVPHGSAPNRSDRSRHAYTVHMIDGSLPYPATNWLQRTPDMPLRGFA
ncbi:MAG: phytanoyl-CoA dioxygenase family protein [Alphaproteobacteria bacterium]